MKLTGIAKQNIGVTLYVITDKKVTVDGYKPSYCSSDDCGYFDTEFADKIKKTDIEELTKELGKSSWYTPKKDKFITKLYAGSIPYSAMTDEVILKNAKNNHGVNNGSMTIWQWIQLPIVFVIYLPYLAFGGFFDLIDSNSGYQGVWAFFSCGALIILSIIGLILSTLFLKRTVKKSKRLILYLVQLPSLWIISMLAASIIVVPTALLFSIFDLREEVIIFDAVAAWTFLVVLFPVLFYRLLWRRKAKQLSSKRLIRKTKKNK
jgi:hypothetical protein